MKVCFLHDNYYRSSGSAIVIRRIFEAFRDTDVDFYFAGCGARAAGGESATEDLSWMPAGHYRSFGLMGLGPELIRELHRFATWLREMPCDVVHVHHRRLASLANLVCSRQKIPLLFTAHNTFPWQAWFWASAPRHVSGVSPSVVRYLRKATRTQAPLLTWNPYPFPSAHEKFSAPSSTPPSPTLPSLTLKAVTIGRLEPVKGHAALIDAWARLRPLGLTPQLDIFGEGYLRAELQRQIELRGLQSQVRLLGFSGDLAVAFANSLFNVLVSETEGFPNVVVEAAAARRASLVTDVDGSRDTVPPDVQLPNRIPFGNIERLTDALATWFQNPPLALEDGDIFHNHLRQRCSPEAVRSQYRQITMTSGAEQSCEKSPDFSSRTAPGE